MEEKTFIFSEFEIGSIYFHLQQLDELVKYLKTEHDIDNFLIEDTLKFNDDIIELINDRINFKYENDEY